VSYFLSITLIFHCEIHSSRYYSLFDCKIPNFVVLKVFYSYCFFCSYLFLEERRESWTYLLVRIKGIIAGDRCCAGNIGSVAAKLFLDQTNPTIPHTTDVNE
jgi:hypothetical protein